ncbi:hypothetical protein ALFP_2360 [Alcaligenes faecalis]|nr:hypothetical protein ALFP_2360 [Alcaligenes faecalis]
MIEWELNKAKLQAVSVDYEGERNFVELVLQRYQQASAVLDTPCMKKIWTEE